MLIGMTEETSKDIPLPSDKAGTTAQDCASNGSAQDQNSVVVKELRTTFFWPLTMQVNDADWGKPCRSASGQDSAANFLKCQFAQMSRDDSPWHPVKDSLHHLPHPAADAQDRPERDAQAYGEFIYFHDFVQRALFGSTSNPNSGHPLLMLQRQDITDLAVTYGSGTDAWTLSFTVERLNLYFVRPGVAVLVLQCAYAPEQGPGINLQHAMRFNDGMRRSHFPYFFRDGAELTQGGKVPTKVIWTNKDGKEVSFTPGRPGPDTAEGLEDQEGPAPVPAYNDLLTQKPEHRRVLPFAHWLWLLNGSEVKHPRMPLDPGPGRKLHWRHFSDDRLPILTTLILRDRDDYYRISEGNWMRLAFVDPPGDDPFPYHPGFMQPKFAQHCYDRYHHCQNAIADAPTRYLMCDYAMTAVTYHGETRPGTEKVNFFAAELSIHMQRHYYQLFLLNVIDKVVMLHLSSRTSDAVERHDIQRLNPKTRETAESALSDAIQEIERAFLHYVHRFRFTGVSGQLQPTEMHAQLRAVMNLNAMFDDLRTELDTAVSFLATREAEHATEASERLNVIATLGVVLALVIGFFSMNLLTTENMLIREDGRAALWQHIGWLGAGLCVVSLAALALSLLMSIHADGRLASARPSVRIVRWTLGAFGLVGGALALLGWS